MLTSVFVLLKYQTQNNNHNNPVDFIGVFNFVEDAFEFIKEKDKNFLRDSVYEIYKCIPGSSEKTLIKTVRPYTENNEYITCLDFVRI